MAPTPRDAMRWVNTARTVEEFGYDTLVVPDGLRSLSALPALAYLAGATTDLKVGTFVLAAPLRPPRLVAWDAHTISLLTDGRFELGIGAGLPDTGREAKEEIGLADLSPGQRIDHMNEVIDLLRKLDEDRHTPILVAAGGPRSRTLAATKADIITLATGPLIAREELATLIDDIRLKAGDRFEDLEFAANIFAVGDEEIPPELLRFAGTDAATLIKHRSLTILHGSVSEMVAELQLRRETLGISYFIVNATFIEQMAPVVAQLSGR